MRDAPLRRMLPDCRRMQLREGPIDLVIGAFGSEKAVAAAYDAAAARFEGLLAELCAELAILRAPAEPGRPRPKGTVARRMATAVAPFAEAGFITPMAAVAGAVAEEILGAMVKAARLKRAFVNNGGDIALHLSPGERFAVGLVDGPAHPCLFATAEIAAEDPVRGIATSGRGGRSFSLGIADAATVLASTAAAADAAATVIGNAVDLPGHPAIRRVPANSLQPDSDLGDRLVTRGVGPLGAREIQEALDRGLAAAEALRDAGLIVSAAVHLQGITRTLPAARILPTVENAGASDR